MSFSNWEDVDSRVDRFPARLWLTSFVHAHRLIGKPAEVPIRANDFDSVTDQASQVTDAPSWISHAERLIVSPISEPIDVAWLVLLIAVSEECNNRHQLVVIMTWIGNKLVDGHPYEGSWVMDRSLRCDLERRLHIRKGSSP